MRRGLIVGILLALLTALVLTGLHQWRLQQPILDGTRPLPPVLLDGRWLSVANHRFEVRGVNYLRHSDEDPLLCAELHFGADGNCPFELDAIERDMARLSGLGVNTVRVFLNYYAFGGAQATDPAYSPAMALRHLDQFIATANRYGIYVLPVLLAKYPQDQFGTAQYEVALNLHVRPIVKHLAGKPGLLAWDLFNEPDIGSPVDQRCWDWSNLDYPPCFDLANQRLRFLVAIQDEVKRLDPERLNTIGVAFAKSYFQPDNSVLRLADSVDFYSFHYYDNDPYDSGRYAQHWYYGQGFPADLRRSVAELHALGLEKPVLISEIGFPTGSGTLRQPAQLPTDLRLALQTLREEQACGAILWPFQAEPEVLIGSLFKR